MGVKTLTMRELTVDAKKKRKKEKQKTTLSNTKSREVKKQTNSLPARGLTSILVRSCWNGHVNFFSGKTERATHPEILRIPGYD